MVSLVKKSVQFFSIWLLKRKLVILPSKLEILAEKSIVIHYKISQKLLQKRCKIFFYIISILIPNHYSWKKRQKFERIHELVLITHVFSTYIEICKTFAFI